MNEFQLCTLAFMSWMIEREHGRQEVSEMWYNRFSALLDDIECVYDVALGKEQEL